MHVVSRWCSVMEVREQLHVRSANTALEDRRDGYFSIFERFTVVYFHFI